MMQITRSTPSPPSSFSYEPTSTDSITTGPEYGCLHVLSTHVEPFKHSQASHDGSDVHCLGRQIQEAFPQLIPRDLEAIRIQLVRAQLPTSQFNSRGRLLIELSDEIIEALTSSMDEPSTLPLTQPVRDARRDGKKSMLSAQDECDILCILVPASGPAWKATALVAELTPQHVLHSQATCVTTSTHVDGSGEPTTTSTTRGEIDSDEEQLQQINTQAQEGEVVEQEIVARDIALRMSSKIHNPQLGFVFGRNTRKCDLLLSLDANTKISNCHFRIFVNRHGVLMFEDTSTNGTVVDNHLLRRQPVKGVQLPTHRTLNAGSIIDLPTASRMNEESTRFLVKFPNRDNAGDQYNHNLASYLVYIEQAERQMRVAAAKHGDMPPPPLLPFNALKDKAKDSPNASMVAAATNGSNHGIQWNGANKYNIVSQIGKGAFAIVYKLSSINNGEVFACKQIEKRRFIKDGILNIKAHNEILVMKDLEHPNIVKYIEYHETRVHIFIVMEFVPLGDLSLYTDAGTVMPEYMCQMMAGQMVHALDYLHKKRITHRDIKPDNILVASQCPYIFKLSDFGLSKMINSEETFLKSFCGTLLYCAPEIYPGFQRVRMGLHPSKRMRSGEPRKGTQPYEHSVDIWSISAVLFHLLCGHAPYSGSMEDEGALMLMNIMKAPPRWERLEQAGISAEGIDFIQRTLIIDPLLRAREDLLLSHPWINPGVDSLQSLPPLPQDDVGDELDASQLSLADVKPGMKAESPEDLPDLRDTKRSKLHQQTDIEPAIDLFHGLARNGSWLDRSLSSAPVPADHRDRLFGEIGSSALQSSGVLGEDAHAALGVDAGNDLESAGYAKESLMGGTDEGEHIPAEDDKDKPDVLEQISQQPLPYPHVLPKLHEQSNAPSLLGTEAVLHQLNMECMSETSVDSRPDSPQTPSSRDRLQVVTNGKGSFRSFAAGEPDVTPGRNRLDNISHPSQSRSQHSQSSRGRPSLPGSGRGSSQKARVRTSSRTSNHPSEDANDVDDKSDVSLPPTTYNSQGSECLAAEDLNLLHDSPLQRLTRSQAGPHAINARLTPPDTDLRDIVDEPEAASMKPPFRFGVLTPTSSSIPSIPIRLTTQYTSFGREPSCNYVHPDPSETRIPKNALDIAMWYPGIEKDIDAGSTNWHLKESLEAILSTRTNLWIKVNETRLMKGVGCWQYGQLKTGDIITIFGPNEGSTKSRTRGRESEHLQFRCEFYVGDSKGPRGEGEIFNIRKEEEQFRLAEARRSRDTAGAKTRGSGQGNTNKTTPAATEKPGRSLASDR